jgi:hypothetical protein
LVQARFEGKTQRWWWGARTISSAGSHTQITRDVQAESDGQRAVDKRERRTGVNSCNRAAAEVNPPAEVADTGLYMKNR